MERTLLEINDGLAHVPSVRLLRLEPHRAARDSYVATVELGDGVAPVSLRLLAEEVFKNTGAIVLFQPCSAY